MRCSPRYASKWQPCRAPAAIRDATLSQRKMITAVALCYTGRALHSHARIPQPPPPPPPRPPTPLPPLQPCSHRSGRPTAVAAAPREEPGEWDDLLLFAIHDCAADASATGDGDTAATDCAAAEMETEEPDGDPGAADDPLGIGAALMLAASRQAQDPDAIANSPLSQTTQGTPFDTAGPDPQDHSLEVRTPSADTYAQHEAHHSPEDEGIRGIHDDEVPMDSSRCDFSHCLGEVTDATDKEDGRQSLAGMPCSPPSSRDLLVSAHLEKGTEDTAAVEEVVSKLSSASNAAAWQLYNPSSAELAAAAAALDEAGEEMLAQLRQRSPPDPSATEDRLQDGDDEEELVAANEMQGRFWWLQPQPRAEVCGEAEALSLLRIPDKEGHVVEREPANHVYESETGGSVETETAAKTGLTQPPQSARPRMRAVNGNSYLAQQDRLYLAPHTPPEAQAPDPSRSVRSRQCVLVTFGANDLRVHDNYALALAAVRAHAGGGGAAGPVPVVAVCVLDIRTFAQPSVVGGFFRQSPLRAQFLLDTVAALREKLETEYGVPLLVRVGRPEEHVPRLAIELGAMDVIMTTQYAPHERRVHDAIMEAVRSGTWVSRIEVESAGEEEGDLVDIDDEKEVSSQANEGMEYEDPLYCVRVVQHTSTGNSLDSATTATAHRHHHPYGDWPGSQPRATIAHPHSVWQSTLVHLDDLPTPVAAMKEGERWYHDDVTTAVIRPTRPYDRQVERLKTLPRWEALLPSTEGSPNTNSSNSNAITTTPSDSSKKKKGNHLLGYLVRGTLPTLFDLGYAEPGHAPDLSRLLNTEEVIATQSSHPAAGEDAAIAHVEAWLTDGGLTSMLRYGRPRRTNTKMYSQRLLRVSPYIAVGALSPRTLYELVRGFTFDNQRDGFIQMQYREFLLRLSRRDYWHWMGLRYGDRLFFSYGPHPDATDGLPNWRHDAKIVQRWCTGLTGIPFADAAMKELLSTGFVASEGRQALVWLLTRGYGQDWRLGAEWLERCSLDYDPFVCYGNSAHVSELLLDDFGNAVHSIHYLAHHHDQTGIYVKKWLPQLSKVPPVYIHRPHVLTPRMQAMHGVFLGRNYPFPLKLWDGAQHQLSAAQLTSYFPGESLTTGKHSGSADSRAASTAADADSELASVRVARGPGYAEAVRCGTSILQPEELSTAVHAPYVAQRRWAQSFLPSDTLQAITRGEVGGEGEKMWVPVRQRWTAVDRQREARPYA